MFDVRAEVHFQGAPAVVGSTTAYARLTDRLGPVRLTHRGDQRPGFPPPPAPPFAPYVAPKPSGPAVGHDLLDAELRADELAALARGVLLFSERREKDVRALAKEFCERDEKHVEDWLAGVGRCKRREERDDMCKGVARWLRHRAATAQIDAANA